MSDPVSERDSRRLRDSHAIVIAAVITAIGSIAVAFIQVTGANRDRESAIVERDDARRERDKALSDLLDAQRQLAARGKRPPTSTGVGVEKPPVATTLPEKTVDGFKFSEPHCAQVSASGIACTVKVKNLMPSARELSLYNTRVVNKEQASTRLFDQLSRAYFASEVSMAGSSTATHGRSEARPLIAGGHEALAELIFGDVPVKQVSAVTLFLGCYSGYLFPVELSGIEVEPAKQP